MATKKFQTVDLDKTLSDKLIFIKGKVIDWFRQENWIFTFIMEEEVTNGMMLSVINGIISGCFLVFSPSAGAKAVIMCFIWFSLSLLLCKKIKN